MSKILIIDDDDDIIESLSIILEGNGFTVSAKKDTDNLVQDVITENPDLIILDIMFPEDPQAGFKAARNLFKNEKFAHIPLLVLSAVNQRTNLAFGFTESDISEDFMPVKGFLEKPVEPGVLVEKINTLLTRSRST